MNHKEKINSFEKSSITTYPSLKNYNFSLSHNLVADFQITIPQKTEKQINDFVKSIFNISRHPKYTDHLLAQYPEYKQLLGVDNYSVLMSYDFHVDENDNAKLIEINTNASSYLIGNELSKILESTDKTQVLKNAFEHEFSKSTKPINNIAIIDENPKDQFMYLEFLMFKDLFKSWGYDCTILDYRNLKYENNQLLDSNNKPIDFIYNRYCDFDLTDPSSKNLLSAYTKKECLFSPNPKEYLLLADKNRMIEWSQPELNNQLGLSTSDSFILDQTLIKSQSIYKFNNDELWTNRKKYFFKPTQSFGGKSVYRGKSITKKTFERLLTVDTLVQEFIPAPTVVVNEQKWKYDLRAFAYKDQVQYILARAYQGQVTNLQTLGGGLALIKVNNT